MKNKSPEFRQDPVSSEWVLLSPARSQRPSQFAKHKKDRSSPVKGCPFEDPQAHGNGVPMLWYVTPRRRKKKGPVELKDWFLQVIKNKYPAVYHHYAECPFVVKDGISVIMQGVGFHEVIITRSHTRSIARMSSEEIELIVRAYQERIKELSVEKCIEFILVFHNHGYEAGASMFHPHSQLIALPIIPRDIHRSLEGSRQYYKKNKRCVHCDINKYELKAKKRIIYKNSAFAVYTPFASQVRFEFRIVPLRHESRYENISERGRVLLADAFKRSFSAMYKALDNPAYNFFIHTTPVSIKKSNHYHWHIEVLPKTSTFAGLELGSGMEILTVSPEDAAEFLRKNI